MQTSISCAMLFVCSSPGNTRTCGGFEIFNVGSAPESYSQLNATTTCTDHGGVLPSSALLSLGDLCPLEFLWSFANVKGDAASAWENDCKSSQCSIWTVDLASGKTVMSSTMMSNTMVIQAYLMCIRGQRFAYMSYPPQLVAM